MFVFPVEQSDVLLPSSDPIFLFLNARSVRLNRRCSRFKGSPRISVGYYNIGFRKGVTDYNVLHLMFQKTLPMGGYISAGIYHGMSDALFTNSDGKIVKTGAMVGWSSPDIKVGLKGLEKIDIIADIQTGKNVVGGGGFGAAI